MVIDKGKLVALLVEKTGRSKEQVEAQLSQFKSRVQEVAQSGDKFEIEGFGTFVSTSGSLEFKASEQLKTEINQKYAGMKPIELIEAFKESGAGVPVEESPQKPGISEPLVEAEAEEVDHGRVPSDSNKGEEIGSEPSDQPEAAPGEDTKKKETPEAVPTAKREGGEKPQPASSSQKTTKDRPAAEKGKTVARQKESDTMGTVLAAAVVLIVVLVGGWFLYDSGAFTSAEGNGNAEVAAADTTNKETVQGTSSSADADDSTVAAGSVANGTEQSGADTVSQNDAAGQQSTSATYGLRGEVSEQGLNGYTIVIHSFRLRSTVQEIADSLKQHGYRTVLFEGSPDSRSRWRLGLGQFESIENAQQAVQRLSAPYQENHFIKRIQ